MSVLNSKAVGNVTSMWNVKISESPQAKIYFPLKKFPRGENYVPTHTAKRKYRQICSRLPCQHEFYCTAQPYIFRALVNPTSAPQPFPPILVKAGQKRCFCLLHEKLTDPRS